MALNLDSISNITEPINTSKQADVKHPTEVASETSGEEKLNQVQFKTANKKLEEMRIRKKKKTRRAKRRKLKPYPIKLSWQQRKLQQKKESKRAIQRIREEIFTSGQPVAPNNTTQFLMEDHNDLEQLDVHLKPPATNPECSNTNNRPARARDSSFSVDSEEDYFYSSPEDEEEFLTKEFSNTYEDLHAERLSSMPKAQLVEEYMELEHKIDVLETKLKNNSEADSSKSDFNVDSHENIHVFKQKLNKITLENERLHREIEQLRRLSYKSQNADSSIDSESDSTDSTCSTSSDSSSEEKFSNKPLPSKNDDIK